MKKIVVAIVLIMMMIGLVACGGGDVDAVADKISFEQSSSYFGTCDAFNVYVMSGVMERPFSPDGERGTMSEFCRITLRGKENNLLRGTFTYTLTYNGEELSGAFSKDYGNSYSADTRVAAHSSGLSKLVIGDGINAYEITLCDNMTGISIDRARALEIARGEFEEKIAADTDENGIFKREVHIKFVNDWGNPDSEYYWYVAFIGGNHNSYAVLIDKMSGEVMAKR